MAAMSFIRRLGDPILKSSATPVDRFDDSLRRQVSRMAGIMGDAFGVGLAAPQLGLSQRLLVYRVGPDAPLVALANPELEWTSDDQETLDYRGELTMTFRIGIRFLLQLFQNLFNHHVLPDVAIRNDWLTLRVTLHRCGEFGPVVKKFIGEGRPIAGDVRITVAILRWSREPALRRSRIQ